MRIPEPRPLGDTFFEASEAGDGGGIFGKQAFRREGGNGLDAGDPAPGGPF